jgi:hypothetical protein
MTIVATVKSKSSNIAVKIVSGELVFRACPLRCISHRGTQFTGSICVGTSGMRAVVEALGVADILLR